MLQGGGALGAYQVGVYEALHEAGIEPDWVIGTSIGAINAALISGNRPEDRLARLEEFWHRVEQQRPVAGSLDWLAWATAARNLNTVARGIPAFFTPNPAAFVRQQGRGRRRGGVVLQHRAVARDAQRSRRLRVPVRVRDAAHGRRGQRLQRRDALLRQPQGAARRRARDGLGRAAAGLRRDPHRRRAVLGRRHLLEHADRGGARRQAAPRFADLRGQRLAPDRARAGSRSGR